MKSKMGKMSGGGEGMQKGPKVSKVPMKAGSASGRGRLEKIKAYGSKPGKGKSA